jgi:hypothetical protein
MGAFRDAIEKYDFHDLGWSGMEYTWNNGHAGDANVKARLDRAFDNFEFVDQFGYTHVRHIVTTESDQCFIMAEFVNRWLKV